MNTNIPIISPDRAEVKRNFQVPRRPCKRGVDDLVGEILWLEEQGIVPGWKANLARYVYRLAQRILAEVLA